jgi:two-component system, OmpR family, response regulator
MPTINVMLVEDEADFREPIARYLSKVGMDVLGVASVEEMDVALNSFRPDVIVLDVNLPGESGFEAACRLRATTSFGLVILTARGSVDDRVHGLMQGADTYLAKSVDSRELEAVIRNLCRRIRGEQSVQPPWIFRCDAWTLVSPDGEEIKLSGAEYRVVAALTATPGKPVTRDILFEAIGRTAMEPDDRSLDVLVSKLRRKFKAPTTSLPVMSVRGIGYVFTDPVSVIGTLSETRPVLP